MTCSLVSTVSKPLVTVTTKTAFVPPAPGTLSPLASCRNLAAASTVSIHPLNLKPSNAEDLHDKSASYSLQRGRWPQRRRLLTPLRSTDDDENSETEPPVPSDYDGRDGNNEPKSFGRGSWEGGGSSAEAGKDSGDPAMRSKLKATLIRKGEEGGIIVVCRRCRFLWLGWGLGDMLCSCSPCCLCSVGCLGFAMMCDGLMTCSPHGVVCGPAPTPNRSILGIAFCSQWRVGRGELVPSYT